MTTAANDNVSNDNASNSNDRPASFDARVMAYMPGMQKLAARHVPPQYRDDLVVDTIINALSRWQTFREDGGMWTWLVWVMRGVAKNQAQKSQQLKRRGIIVSFDKQYDLAEQPRQYEYTELSETLSTLSDIKGGDVLLRRAMGDSFEEIAKQRGVTKQRVQQIEVAARRRLKKACAYRKVAA